MPDDKITGADLLRGWGQIGRYLNTTAEAARRMGSTAGLPTFRLGPKIVASTRPLVDAWLSGRQAMATKDHAA